RRHTAPLATRPQRVQQRDEKPRATRADGMTERDGTAVGVELGVWNIELAAYAFDAAEGLVHFEEVDVVNVPAGLLEAAGDRTTRRGEELLGLVSVLTLRDDARERCGPELPRAV